MVLFSVYYFFFFNDTATTEIYTLSLHDALPILPSAGDIHAFSGGSEVVRISNDAEDRKSTRLNSSHPSISYAVFCLKKKNYFTDAAKSIYETTAEGDMNLILGAASVSELEPMIL